MNLSDNHDEYWKIIRHGGEGIKGHTIVFPWFATWPATKRTKESPKAIKTNPLAWWHCTRKQLYAGPELDHKDIGTAPRVSVYQEGRLLWEKWGGYVDFTGSNQRQGWDKYGNAARWPWGGKE